MNILKDKYLLQQSQQKSINSKGEEVNLDLGLTANKNIIFGPNYSGFTISDSNVFPTMFIPMKPSYLSNGATINYETGYVQNLGDITIEIYVPKNFGGNYYIQINYISGAKETYASLTVNSTTKEETFYATYDWQAENAYVFNTNINLIAGKNIIKISKVAGKIAPWIGGITLAIVDSSYQPQYYPKVIKIQPPAQQMEDGFIGPIGGEGAYVEESVNVPYAGKYMLNISYITGPNPVQLLVGVNGKAGIVNNIPQSQSPWEANMVPFKIDLNKGNNVIKLYTNNGAKGPWIGPLILSKTFYNYPVYPFNTTLTGSSKNYRETIVYSGFGVGSISFTATNVPKSGQYNLIITYFSPVPINDVYIYINGKYIGQPQKFVFTDSINSVAYKIVPINLNQGNNTITIS